MVIVAYPVGVVETAVVAAAATAVFVVVVVVESIPIIPTLLLSF